MFLCKTTKNARLNQDFFGYIQKCTDLVDNKLTRGYNGHINSNDKEPVGSYKADRESLFGGKGCADGC